MIQVTFHWNERIIFKTTEFLNKETYLKIGKPSWAFTAQRVKFPINIYKFRCLQRLVTIFLNFHLRWCTCNALPLFLPHEEIKRIPCFFRYFTSRNATNPVAWLDVWFYVTSFPRILFSPSSILYLSFVRQQPRISSLTEREAASGRGTRVVSCGTREDNRTRKCR